MTMSRYIIYITCKLADYIYEIYICKFSNEPGKHIFIVMMIITKEYDYWLNQCMIADSMISFVFTFGFIVRSRIRFLENGIKFFHEEWIRFQSKWDVRLIIPTPFCLPRSNIIRYESMKKMGLRIITILLLREMNWYA